MSDVNELSNFKKAVGHPINPLSRWLDNKLKMKSVNFLAIWCNNLKTYNWLNLTNERGYKKMPKPVSRIGRVQKMLSNTINNNCTNSYQINLLQFYG